MTLHACHVPFPDVVERKLYKYTLKEVNVKQVYCCIVYYNNVGKK